jgi:hypothetical protein
MSAAEAAAEAFERQGRRVMIRKPPAGCKDFNEFLQNQRANGAA